MLEWRKDEKRRRRFLTAGKVMCRLRSLLQLSLISSRSFLLSLLSNCISPRLSAKILFPASYFSHSLAASLCCKSFLLLFQLRSPTNHASAQHGVSFNSLLMSLDSIISEENLDTTNIALERSIQDFSSNCESTKVF